MSFTKVTSSQSSQCICLEEIAINSEVYIHDNGGELHPFQTQCIDAIVSGKNGENIVCPICRMTIFKVNGVFLEADSPNEMVAIDRAARTNNLPLARHLLEASADPVLLRGVAICNAASCGNAGFIETLLQEGAILEPARGNAVFQASWGHLQAVRVLLQNATIDEIHLSGSVNRAIEQGNTEILRTLLDGRTISIENRGAALLAATQNSHLQAVQILLANGPIPAIISFNAAADALASGNFSIAGAITTAQISAFTQTAFGAMADNLDAARNN